MSDIPGDGLDDEVIKGILRKRHIAVVGASRDTAKAAGFVPEFLMKNGYDIIPVNPFAETILGRRCYKSLADIGDRVDVVDVFRPSAEAERVVGDAAAKGVKIVWLQEGIYSPGAAQKGRAMGLTIAWNRCLMKEFQRVHGAQL
jgi:hypothetical protein